MKNQDDLSSKIYLVTQKIQEEFPVLLKYLNEIPNPIQIDTKEDVNQDELKNYLDALNDILEKHANEQ